MVGRRGWAASPQSVTRPLPHGPATTVIGTRNQEVMRDVPLTFGQSVPVFMT